MFQLFFIFLSHNTDLIMSTNSSSKRGTNSIQSSTSVASKRSGGRLVSPQGRVKFKKGTKPSHMHPVAIKKEKKKTEEKVIIDMSGDDDNFDFGTPFDVLKKQNLLYFSYDPRGLTLRKKLPDSYCKGCRCPENYCADDILGSMSSDHALTMLNERGSLSDLDAGDFKACFKLAYSEAVENKMRWNSVKFDCTHSSSISIISVPTCVRYGHMKQFINDMKAEKTRDENYPDWVDLDMKEGEVIGDGRGETDEVEDV